MWSVCHGYMYIILYMRLIQCSGVAETYGQLEEWVGSVCHRYVLILLYVELMQYSGFPEIYA